MKKATGITRIINAGSYSIKGFKSAFKNEVAFKQEIYLLVVALLIVFFVDFPFYQKIILIGSVCVVMIVELLNSAIECVVDRISLEHHELSGRAKDYGSAAVLISLLLTLTIWIYIFICHFFP